MIFVFFRFSASRSEKDFFCPFSIVPGTRPLGSFSPGTGAALAMIGAQICIERVGYKHHAIVSKVDENGNIVAVIHYVGNKNKAEASIKETAYACFLGPHDGIRTSPGTVCVVSCPPSRFSPEEVVQRARSKIGMRGYQFVTNNCEHFATLCRVGEAMSTQVEDAKTGAFFAAGVLLAGGVAALLGVLFYAFGSAKEEGEGEKKKESKDKRSSKGYA
jgi:hypothetical protein